jgi:hypothetical protein
VWEKLVEIGGEETEMAALRQSGRKWLTGREERPDWNYVWRKLVGITTDRTEVTELRQSGKVWLTGREDRPDWAFVWQKLVEISTEEAEVAALRRSGQNWVAGREERPDWNYVWRKLVGISTDPTEVTGLRQSGENWLPGREDRAEWAYVWRTTIALTENELDSVRLRAEGLEQAFADRRSAGVIMEWLMDDAFSRGMSDEAEGIWPTAYDWLTRFPRSREWERAWIAYWTRFPSARTLAALWPWLVAEGTKERHIRRVTRIVAEGPDSRKLLEAWLDRNGRHRAARWVRDELRRVDREAVQR